MGFYDDASLIFLAGAEAGKDGKAYSIKPVPEYGSELVTNGDFSNGLANWVVDDGTSWTNVNNTAFCDGNNGLIKQNISSTQNKVYKVTFDTIATNSSGKQLGVRIDNGVYAWNLYPTGTHTIYATAGSLNTQGILFYAVNGWTGSIDNVSVKEVLVDGDFTFSRGSNLSATRVGADGLIEKGRENLVLQSNAFTTSPWLQTDATATIGQSGYDGTNNAWLIDKSGANGRIRQLVSATGVVTTSIYAKAGTNNWLRISFAKFAFFDLANGVIGNTNAIDTTITSVGNGWYRCTMTANPTSAQFANYYPAEDDNVISGTSGNIIMQSIQVEQGLAATDYIESGASTGKAGLLEDEPRFDYSGGATCPSLLLEPSRTNLIVQSEYIAGLDTAGSPTLSLESETNPSGNAFAYKATATSTSSRVQKSLGTQGNNFVFSGFFKGSGAATRIRFRNNQGEGVFYNIDTNGAFTLYSENAVNDNYGIEDYGNGWHRIFFETTTSNSSVNYVQVYCDVLDGDGSFLVWGLQAEAGSYPTSYIPNHSGGSVTRGFDYSIVESLGYSSTCTFYYEFNTTTGRDTSSPFAEIGKDQSNKIWIKGASADSPQFSVQGNGIFSGSVSPTNEVSGTNKIAVQWSSGVGVVFSNGVKQNNTLTNSNTSENIDFIVMKGQGTSHDSKQLLFFEEALSDADCITLTTI